MAQIKNLFVLLVWLSSVIVSHAQISPAPGVSVRDEGTLKGRSATIDCVGSGVVCDVVGGVTTITGSGVGTGLSEPAGDGIVIRSGAGNTVNRTLTGTTGNLVCTNGDGVAGNPTCDVGSTIVQTDQANTYTAGLQNFNAATVNLPASFSVAGVSVTTTAAQLNFLNTLASNIQTQIDGKASVASPTFTGVLTTPAITLGATALTATGVELNRVAGVTSGIQAQLDLKAPLASPTLVTPTVASLVNMNHDHTNGAGGGTLTEAAIATTDITTNNATSAKHGFLPKLSALSNEFLNGEGAWAVPSGGGGGASNSFETQNVPTGTDPVAETGTDTLNWVATAPVAITGDSTTDTLTVAVSGASTTAPGVVELATDGETASGVAVQGDDARLSNDRTPSVHATTHQHGGTDEIATGIPAADVIPKANSGGTLADGWLASTVTRDTELDSFGEWITFTGVIGACDSTSFVRGDGACSVPTGAGDVSSNTATSVDSEVAVFSSTTGKIVKRATGTGIARLTNGVLSASEASGDLASSGSNAFTIQPNSVALTADTTGNYVVGVAGTANEIAVSHTPSEGSTPTISLPTGIAATKIGGGGVTSAEFDFMSTVTSNVQAQIDLKAPMASPTFTGVPAFPIPFTLGGTVVTTTGAKFNFLNDVTSLIQAQLDAKAPLTSPSFNGTVSIPTPFNLGGVSVLPTAAKFNFVNNVTSDIQAQIDGKQASLGFTAENAANKNATNGYAGLSSGKVAIGQLQEVLGLADFSDVSAKKGNATIVQMQTGATTTDDCAKFDANGNLVSAGGACGVAGSIAFNGLVGGTNTTAAMVVGTGSSITQSGAGTIVASTRGAKEKAVSKYASLNAAITAASAGDTIIIDAATSLTGSVTVPATIRLEWVGCNQITIGAAQTLTIASSPSQWPECTLFIGAGATPGVSFAGNIGMTFVSPVWWGANGTDATDDSNAFNYASSALMAGSTTRTGIVRIPRGIYYAANVLLKHGIQWEGVSVASTSWEGTTIQQLASSNANVFLTDGALCGGGGVGYMHWVQVRNMRIIGDKATNTLGSGIVHGCATGELNNFSNLAIQNFPENGLVFTGLGTNVLASHLALHANGVYGLKVEANPGTSLNLCHFEDVSGDNNGTSLIYYKPSITTQASCFFTHIKSETSSGTNQQDVIVLDNIGGTPVYIENVSAAVLSTFTLNSIVRNTSTSSARIIGRSWRATGPGTITNLIDDQNSALTLPYVGNANLFQFAWHSTLGVVYKADTVGFAVKNLFNAGVNTQTGATYTMTTLDENKLLAFNRATAVAVTLPIATAQGFTVGAIFMVYNRGVGTVTITPTTSTINGAATLVLTTGQGAHIVSDGTDYSALVGAAGGTVTDASLTTTDITTNNATTAKHGFLPKLSNIATEFLNGQGAWTTPAGGGSGSNSFETQAVPAGTSPVAESSADTLNWVATAPVTITGTSATDTMTVAVSDATTTTKGAVELATNGDTGANVAVQGNDTRMNPVRSVVPTGNAFGGCVYTNDVLNASKPIAGYFVCTDNNADGFDFDVIMPDTWNAGTVTVEIAALSINATPSGNLVMSCSGQAVRSGDTVANRATTGEQTATLTFAATSREQHATTAAITLQGTVAAGAHLYMHCDVDATGTTATMTDVKIIATPKMNYTIG